MMSPNSADPARNTPFFSLLMSFLNQQRQDSLSLLKRWPVRAAAVLAMFLWQGLWLTIRFDTASIAESADAWGQLIQLAPMLPPIGASVLLLMPLLARQRIARHACDFAASAEGSKSWWVWWLAQWAAFALVVAASAAVFGDGTVKSRPDPTRISLWILAVMLNCTCFFFALAAPGFWFRFVRSEIRVLLIALPISAGAMVGGSLFQRLWTPLGQSTFRVVRWCLGFFYHTHAIVADPEACLLGTNSFYVHVAPECSGYEGMGLISAFLCVFLFVFRHNLRFPQAWLLLPIGMVTAWCCNSLRIATLILIGTEYSPSVALGGFHSQAGWILFTLVALGLMVVTLQSKTLARHVPATIPATCPAAAYLVPFLLLTAISMLMAAVVDDAARLYPIAFASSVAALWFSRNVLRNLRWTISVRVLGCGIAVFILWTVLAWFDGTARGSVTTPLPSCATLDGLLWTMVRVTGAVITVPIIEELAFRGFLLRRLTLADFENAAYNSAPLWAVLVSSMIFGLLHQLWIGGIVAGAAYAWIARDRNNLVDAIVAHAVTNGLLSVTVLATGATWLW